MREMIMVCLLLAGLAVKAQEREWERVLEDQAAQVEPSELDDDLLMLQGYRAKPMNINKASAGELSAFPFLTGLHISGLLLYRKITGDLVDVLELQAVPGWEPAIVRKIIPYVTVSNAPSLRITIAEDLSIGHHELLLRSSLSKGSGFLLRYRYLSEHIQAGIHLEKDAGERLWQGRKGLSFFSGHLSLKNIGLVRQLVIGDHLVNIGQGLTLWQGRAMRKTALPMMIKRQAPFTQPYRSSDENRFNRGISLLLGRRRWEAGVFISMNGLDVNTKVDTLTGKRSATSLLLTGLHRDKDELADKNALYDLSAGMMVSAGDTRTRVGVHAVHHRFSIPWQKAAEPYNRFAISGRSLSNVGLSYQRTWKAMHLFGELAWDHEGHPAAIQGVMFAADRKLDVSLLYRKIHRGYNSFMANAFTESGEPVNEEGIYMGLSFRPHPQLTLDLYVDHFRFPWVRYRQTSPGRGRDQLMQAGFRPDKRTLLVARWKQEDKPEDVSLDPVKRTEQIMRRSWRLHVEHRVSLEWEVRGRVEGNVVHIPGFPRERGFVLFGEMFWKSSRYPLGCNGRIMMYDTDSYTSRIYAYENDVMYYNSVPGFYGRGVRLYANISWEVTEHLRMFMKWSSTSSADRKGTTLRMQLLLDIL